VVLGLNIDVEEIDRIIILRLSGRLDVSSCSFLQNRLESFIKDKREVVLLDFANIDYLSSAGLRVLLSYTKRFEEAKKRLAIFSVTEDVLEIIKLTGFEKILKIFKNEKEAILEKR
jgi:anti-anti-sigma factor